LVKPPQTRKLGTEKLAPVEDTLEPIDISKQANALEIYSDGSLERLDKENKIKTHWFKQRTIVYLSASVIVAILICCLATIGFSSDATSRDWARQTMSALLGFAAGTIWQTRK
jgi:hypothetical protein